MTDQTRIDLIVQSILQEKQLQFEQDFSTVFRTFMEQIQEKSKQELFAIHLSILETLQKNYQNEIIASLCMRLLDIVEKQMEKLEE